MAVDAGIQRAGKPGLESPRTARQSLRTRRRARRMRVPPRARGRKAALHVKAGAALDATLDRLGKQAVDLAGVRLGGQGAVAVRGQEGAVKQVGLRPDLAGDEGVGLAQKMQVIVVEDVRAALVVELGQGQRAAFDLGRDLADQRLEIAFVGDPDPCGSSGRRRRGRGVAGWPSGLAGSGTTTGCPDAARALSGMRRRKRKPALQADIAVEERGAGASRKRESAG